MNTTKNGKLYQTADSAMLSPPLLVTHVYGTAYEMGFAQGELLREPIRQVYAQMLEWIYNEVDEYIHFLPAGVRHWIEREGVEFALNVTLWSTRAYTPQRFLDEAQGLADALGMQQDDILRINLFPSLIQAACSMLGAWGEATSQSSGSLYTLRALDFGVTYPLQQYPQVITYHPSDGGHPFSMLSWAGFIGAITGFSSSDLIICEKVWDAFQGHKTYSGMPWHFVLRDILQFDTTTEEALARLNNAHRTCSIWVGIGELATTNFTIVGYSNDTTLPVYNDHNMPNHTNFKDVVYLDKHRQWSHNKCMPELIAQSYNKIDENALIQLAALFETGDLHLAIADVEARRWFVSNAAPYVNGTTNLKAYQRPFVRLEMKDLWSESL